MANDFRNTGIVDERLNPPPDPGARAVWYREHPDILRDKIMQKWIKIGGSQSSVGLPLDPNFPIKETGDNFEVEFRGGNLKLNNVNAEIDESGLHHVRVTFEGFGLEIR